MSSFGSYIDALNRLKTSVMTPTNPVQEQGVLGIRGNAGMQGPRGSGNTRPGQQSLPLQNVNAPRAQDNAAFNREPAFGAPAQAQAAAASPYAGQRQQPLGPAHPNLQQQYQQAVQRGGPATYTVDPEGVAHGYTEQRGGGSFQRGAQGQLVDTSQPVGLKPHEQFQQDKSTLDEVRSQLANLTKKGTVKDQATGENVFDHRQLSPDEHGTFFQLQQAEKTLNDKIIGHVLNATAAAPLQDQQAAARNRQRDAEVAQAVQSQHPYTQLQPGEQGYKPVDETAERAPLHARQEQEMYQHLESLGVPKSPTPGAGLRPDQVHAIAQVAGTPDAARALAQKLGYSPTIAAQGTGPEMMSQMPAGTGPKKAAADQGWLETLKNLAGAAL